MTGTAHAIGDGEDFGVLAVGEERGGIFVGGPFVRGAGGEDDGFSAGEEVLLSGVHIAFEIKNRVVERGVHLTLR